MKKRKKSRDFFTENYRKSWDYLKASKNYIYIILIIFFFFVLVGALVPAPANLEEIILQYIQKLLEMTEGMSKGELISFIFVNNLQSSFFSLMFGIVFGIFSIITSVLNGYLLGFVSAKAVSEGGIFILWRLFPHGIFELPALFLSAGLGLRLGLPFVYRYFDYYWKKENILALILGVLFLPFSIVLTFLFNKNLRKSQFRDFIFRFNNSFRVFVFVVLPLLIIAAIIEGVLISLS